MNKKAYKDVEAKLREYAEEIRTRQGHLSNAEKQKLLRRAKRLWMNANTAGKEMKPH